ATSFSSCFLGSDNGTRSALRQSARSAAAVPPIRFISAGAVVGSPLSLGATGTSSNPAGGRTSNVNHTTTESVDTANGNAYFTFSDLIVPGKGLRFKFIRAYNSLDNYFGPLCRGWTHSYNILLSVNGSGDVTIKGGDGHQNTFLHTATP